MENKFITLQKRVQEIIDLMAQNRNYEANQKWIIVDELLGEILDHSDTDHDLLQIRRFQMLLNQIREKLQERQP